MEFHKFKVWKRKYYSLSVMKKSKNILHKSNPTRIYTTNMLIEKIDKEPLMNNF